MKILCKEFDVNRPEDARYSVGSVNGLPEHIIGAIHIYMNERGLSQEEAVKLFLPCEMSRHGSEQDGPYVVVATDLCTDRLCQCGSGDYWAECTANNQFCG